MVHKKLFEILCNYYGLYLLSHVYHWNVTGPNFQEVHKMLEGIYGDVIENIDTIAERIRMLDDKIDISFSTISSYSILSNPSSNSDATSILSDLLKNIAKLDSLLKEGLEEYLECEDLVTIDILTRQLSILDKYKWIIKSSLN